MAAGKRRARRAAECDGRAAAAEKRFRAAHDLRSARLMEKHFDVVIVGGGLVGAAFALALRGSGLKLAVIEAHPPAALPNDASWDSRIYAVSPGNAAFLDELGIWSAMQQSRI